MMGQDLKETDPYLETFLLMTCDVLGADQKLVKSKSRRRDLVMARYLYFYAAHERFPKKSLEAIGRVVGKDHSSVHAGIVKAKEYETDPDNKYSDAFRKIRQMIPDENRLRP